MTAPLVSVCIPTFNQERFLQETLESVIKQSYTDFEVLVIDDCSTDRTGEIAQAYATQDPRFRFLANSANLGMVLNWNRCLEMAQGTYVKFLFGDDLLISPDTLGRMVAILDEERDVSLVASARVVIDEESRVVETLAGFPDGVRIPGKVLIKRCLDGSSISTIGLVSLQWSCSVKTRPAGGLIHATDSWWTWKCGSTSWNRGRLLTLRSRYVLSALTRSSRR